jgi:hypothetical protein
MSITLDLPAKIESELVEITREEGTTPDEIITRALNDYLFIRKFRRVREKMQTPAKKIYTDEEIFEMVS